jgi:predicted permease
MIRALLLFVRVAAVCVPVSRRADFVDQWRGELWHYARWLERHGERAAWLRLLARASGVLPHAVQIRILHWSPRMLAHDVKFAWRMFVRRPAFTGVAVLILALGIGANTTIFSWTQALLLSPLAGVARQDRLFDVNTSAAGRDGLSVSYPNYLDLRAARLDGVADLMAFRVLPMTLRADGEPSRVFGELVTANFFQFLGVTPALGRVFREDEGVVPDRDAVAVISHELWRRAFAADPSIVGRSVLLNGRAFTIVGVAPAGFRGSVAAVALDVFVPMTMQKTMITGDRLATRSTSWLEVYGRLAEGASIAQAHASVRVAGARLAEQYPDANKGRDLNAIPLWRAGASGVLLPVLGTLFGVVMLVLLIACANVAGLLLARATGRERELSVRFAVGATRRRVVRQLLVENLLLSAAGCAAGVMAAHWTSGLLNVFVPRTPFPLRLDAALDSRALLFAAGLAVVTTLLSGLVPAWRASRTEVGSVLKAITPTAVRGTSRLRQSLVVAQIGLSAVLLICGSLFARSLGRAASMDPGFSIRNGFLAAIDLQPAGYDEARGNAFLLRLLERVSAVPQVTAVTAARTMPLDLGGSSDMGVTIDGYTPPPGEDVMAYYNQVAPRYFETMGIPLTRGRAIDAGDTVDRPAVVVINETMARRYWPGRDPVGAVIRWGRGPVTVVGVARDGKYARLNETPRNYIYVPALQSYRPDLVLHVRTDADPAAVFPAVRAAVREIDPNLPLFDVRTIEEHMQVATFLQRIAASLLAVFGVLGLLLAAVGLYGVVGFNAAQRAREIGLRMALGAQRRQVVALILREATLVVAVGLGAGLLLSLAAGRLLKTQLTGVSGTDPFSFAGTTVVLLIVAAAAAVIPARRAAAADPLTSLRRD